MCGLNWVTCLYIFWEINEMQKVIQKGCVRVRARVCEGFYSNQAETTLKSTESQQEESGLVPARL